MDHISTQDSDQGGYLLKINFETSDEEFFQLMKANNPSMFSYLQEAMNQAIREGGE